MLMNFLQHQQQQSNNTNINNNNNNNTGPLNLVNKTHPPSPCLGSEHQEQTEPTDLSVTSSRTDHRRLDDDDEDDGDNDDVTECCRHDDVTCPHLVKLKSLRQNVYRMLKVFTPYLMTSSSARDLDNVERDELDQFLHEVIFSSQLNE